MLFRSLAANPDVAAKIEAAIRANAGLIGQNLVIGGEDKDSDAEE